MTDTVIQTPERSRRVRIALFLGRTSLFITILAFKLLVLFLWATAWIIMATVTQNQVSGNR